MTWYYRYRLNGGEVGPYSTEPMVVETAYFGVYESEVNYTLNPPKWSDGSTIRDATAEEIANFPQRRAEDDFDRNKEIAKGLLDEVIKSTDPVSIKDRATLLTFISQFNILRQNAGFEEITNQQAKAGIKANIDAMTLPSF